MATQSARDKEVEHLYRDDKTSGPENVLRKAEKIAKESALRESLGAWKTCSDCGEPYQTLEQRKQHKKQNKPCKFNEAFKDMNEYQL